MKNILLIENETRVREDATEMLETEGYKVHTAANAKSGLRLAKEWLPDIILSDTLNGFDVFNELKKGLSTRYIPFIFLTSGEEKYEMENIVSTGADGYIQKPLETKTFFETVERCLLPYLI